jgi:homoserine dehydrogenase
MSPAYCRIGLVGFGTVGSAVARRLVHDRVPNLALTHIFDRRAPEKRRRFQVENPANPENPAIVWTDRIGDLLTSNVDVIVEAVGGVDPAAEWIRQALLAGKSVVTSNKQVLAHHGPPLLALAARQGRQLRFEAAVGGAMPIVRVIGDGLAGDRIQRIVGILNGTTNMVLSQVEAGGCSMARALDDACAHGYAEADSSADLDGIDAAAKLAILCALAFNVRVDPDAIETRSSAHLTVADFDSACNRGATIRQLAFASYDRCGGELTVWVAPAHVKRGSFFGRTVLARNAAVITGEFGGTVQIAGAGAGGDATAVAIISDLLAVARDRAAIVPAPSLSVPRAIAGLSNLDQLKDRSAPMVESLDGFNGVVLGRDLAAEVL